MIYYTLCPVSIPPCFHLLTHTARQPSIHPPALPLTHLCAPTYRYADYWPVRFTHLSVFFLPAHLSVHPALSHTCIHLLFTFLFTFPSIYPSICPQAKSLSQAWGGRGRPCRNENKWDQISAHSRAPCTGRKRCGAPPTPEM